MGGWQISVLARVLGKQNEQSTQRNSSSGVASTNVCSITWWHVGGHVGGRRSTNCSTSTSPPCPMMSWMNWSSGSDPEQPAASFVVPLIREWDVRKVWADDGSKASGARLSHDCRMREERRRPPRPPSPFASSTCLRQPPRSLPASSTGIMSICLPLPMRLDARLLLPLTRPSSSSSARHRGSRIPCGSSITGSTT